MAAIFSGSCLMPSWSIKWPLNSGSIFISLSSVLLQLSQSHIVFHYYACLYQIDCWTSISLLVERRWGSRNTGFQSAQICTFSNICSMTTMPAHHDVTSLTSISPLITPYDSVLFGSLEEKFVTCSTRWTASHIYVRHRSPTTYQNKWIIRQTSCDVRAVLYLVNLHELFVAAKPKRMFHSLLVRECTFELSND